MTAIEISDLKKNYRVGFWRHKEKAGLKGLSLKVEEGEVFGCLGPNGAGKTTMLKLLMGLILPTSGSARILGMEVNDARVKAQIGFLPEQPYFYDYLTANELLEYYAQLSGMPTNLRSRRVAEMLEKVGLGDSGHVQLRKFSKGMLQRVGIAQAIVHDPKIVFLDEPMSGLDPVGRREVRDLMQWLSDQGKTVFFSTHILSDAEALCDRVAVLHQGELRGLESVSSLLAKARGKMEVLWQAAPEVLQQRGEGYRLAGDTARVVVEESKLEAALDEIRQAGGRLVSVTPVHGTLEEYFLARIGKQESEAAK